MVKGKTIAALRVPQTRDEARQMIAEYGDALRQIERIETDLNATLAKAKREAVTAAGPFATKADQLLKSLQTWCDANRDELTNKGAVKTVDLGTGKVSWRWNPAKVSLRGKVEDIIARIKDSGAQYKKFLRATVEIDKVAMLRDPNLAKQIDGVKIGTAGETFTVEPFAGEELAEAAQ